MYLTFQGYTEMGGKLLEPAFIRYERLASLLVERQTLTRSNNFINQPDEFKHLVFELIELNAAAGTAERMTTSQSNNGVSVTYADADRAAIYERERELVKTFLSNVVDDDGVPVLFTGLSQAQRFARKEEFVGYEYPTFTQNGGQLVATYKTNNRNLTFDIIDGNLLVTFNGENPRLSIVDGYLIHTLEDGMTENLGQVTGKSAYQSAVDSGFSGTEAEWIASLNGKDGVNGTNGANGAAFTYEDFTPAQLEALKGADGRDGVNGTNGTDGISATITIGTTTTLAAGSPATVTNTGTASAAVLNIGVPQGIQGVKGDDATVPYASETEAGKLKVWADGDTLNFDTRA